jgi:hypothetical protein
MEIWFLANKRVSKGGGGGGGDIGPIDSWENVGDPWGVKSVDPVTGPEPDDYFLGTWDGHPGKSIWRPMPAGFANGDDITTAIMTPANLTGWWRLGESTAWPTYGNVVSHWGADSSGNNRWLQANHTGTLDLTTHIPEVHQPGWFAGKPADDGAIIFRATGSFTSQIYTVGLTGVGAFGETSTGWSMSAFVLATSAYYQIPGSLSYPGTLVGDHYHSFGGTNPGVLVQIDPLTRVLSYRTGDGAGNTFGYSTPFSLTPDTWYHFVVTLQKVDATHWRRRIILNLNVLYDQTDVQTVIVPSVSGGTMYMGMVVSETGVTTGACSGGLDEVATWDTTLTDAEIQAIHDAVVTNPGDVWTGGTIGGGSIGAGTIDASHMTSRNTAVGTNAAQYTVPTADGIGGVTYDYPNHRFFLAGVDP